MTNVRKRIFVTITSVVAVVMGFACFTSQPAQAMGLDGSTVAAYSWFPAEASSASSLQTAPDCTVLFCTLQDYTGSMGPTNSPLPTVPVDYVEDFLTLTTTYISSSISSTQITITNNSALPFCTTSLPCSDVFDGLEFVFSSGVHISDVTASGDADFQPISGGLTFTPTVIAVNLAGDTPQVNDQLILDVTTAGTPAPTPLPATLPLFATGLGAMGLLGWRRKRKNAAAFAAA